MGPMEHNLAIRLADTAERVTGDARLYVQAIELEQFAHFETALKTARVHLDGGMSFYAGIDFARARRMLADIHDRELKAKANEMCDELYSRATRSIGWDVRKTCVGECNNGCDGSRDLRARQIEVWECNECLAGEVAAAEEE